MLLWLCIERVDDEGVETCEKPGSPDVLWQVTVFY